MPSIKVYNMKGQETGSMELSEIFAIEYNEPLIHQAVVTRLANERQGTKSSLTRSEVRGGGKKPYRQKGTGNARQGTIRAPHYVGGGVVFGVTPRSYTFKMNKKERQLALKTALTDKVKSNSVVVVDSLNTESVKTKDVKKLIENLKLAGKVLFISSGDAENLYLATRNLGYALVITMDEINCYDLVNADVVVMDAESLKHIEEVLK